MTPFPRPKPALLLVTLIAGCAVAAAAAERPNILFCFSDDWGRYAGIYRDAARPGFNDVIDTPALDRIGRSGVVFGNAFVSAPSCTPSRASVSTGMPFYRCGSQAFLHSQEYGKAPDPFDKLPGFSELLVKNGYHVMHWGKTTRKSARRTDGTHMEPICQFSQTVSAADDPEAEKRKIFSMVRGNFGKFLDINGDDKPFFYWFGPHNSHRQWTRGSGRALWGIDPDSLKGKLPAFLPDVHEVREDVADYLGEALAWDGMVNELVSELEARGELDDTLIIVSGDHGMPGMPRGKCNLHDFGSMVALLVSWPGKIPGNRRVDDFVSLMDIAPTILEAAGIEPPGNMLAKSFLDVLRSDRSGRVDAARDHVIIGRERHVGDARKDRSPYPSRAIRTEDYLLIRNFRPERLPLGEVHRPDATPEQLLNDHNLAYPDMDASPTKVFLMTHEDSHPDQFGYAFDHRPEYELYDLRKDPDQIRNVAADPDHRDIFANLSQRMMTILQDTEDPRVTGDGMAFEMPPFVDPKHAGKSRKKQKPEPKES